jgi:mannan endo-1,4-beta-mannosidase
LSKKPSWWAATSAQSRRSSVGIIALGLVLATLSWVVWSSPVSPVNQALTAAVNGADAANPLIAQNKDLKTQLAALQRRLNTRSSDLAKAKLAASTVAATNTKGLAEAQERVRAAESALAEAESQAATLAAKPKPKAATAPARTTPAKSGSTAASVTPISAPTLAEIKGSTGRFFGMYTQQAPFNWATFDAASVSVGAKPTVVGYFSGWDEAFRSEAVTKAWAHGSMPMMTWESRPINAKNGITAAPDYSLPKIIDGSFDAYLHQYAKDIVATGLPVAIRFNHEMNGTWYPWAEDNGKGDSLNGNNQGDYVKMWKHVHDVFQAEGANEYALWVWAPNIINNLPASHQTPEYLASLYPGDDYVDWVGLSGYLRPPYKAENNFTFDYTFGRSLDQLRNLTGKPIILAEVGASETEGHKVAWVTSLFDSLAKPENNDIVGLAWFNLAVSSFVDGELGTNDWRIDSRPDSLAAFSAGLSNPDDHFTLVPTK